MATKECPAHPNVKRAVLEATDTSTIAVRHGSPAPVEDPTRGNRGFVEERRGSVRMLINDHLKKILTETGGILSYDNALESQGPADPNTESNRTVSAFIFGNLEDKSITASQGSGMIQDIPSCRELIDRMVGEIEPIIKRLNVIYGS
jgi:nitronate monooxygenase